MTVKTNLAARKLASGVADLARAESMRLPPEANGRFWEHMYLEIVDELPGEFRPTPEVVPFPPMTDEEAKAFEKEFMPCGEHINELIGGVPIGYLMWLAGQTSFRRELNRYLRSDAGQQRQTNSDT